MNDARNGKANRFGTLEALRRVSSAAADLISGRRFTAESNRSAKILVVIHAIYGLAFGIYAYELVNYLGSGRAQIILAISLLLEIPLQPIYGIVSDVVGRRWAVVLAFAATGCGEVEFAILPWIGSVNGVCCTLLGIMAECMVAFGSITFTVSALSWLKAKVFDFEGIRDWPPDRERPTLAPFIALARIAFNVTLAGAGWAALKSIQPMNTGPLKNSAPWVWFASASIGMLGAAIAYHILKEARTVWSSSSLNPPNHRQGDTMIEILKHPFRKTKLNQVFADISTVMQTPLLGNVLWLYAFNYAIMIALFFFGPSVSGGTASSLPWFLLGARLAGLFTTGLAMASKDRIRPDKCPSILAKLVCGAAISVCLASSAEWWKFGKTWVLLTISLCFAITQAVLPIASDFVGLCNPPHLNSKEGFVRSVGSAIGAAIMSLVCLLNFAFFGRRAWIAIPDNPAPLFLMVGVIGLLGAGWCSLQTDCRTSIA